MSTSIEHLLPMKDLLVTGSPNGIRMYVQYDPAATVQRDNGGGFIQVKPSVPFEDAMDAVEIIALDHFHIHASRGYKSASSLSQWNSKVIGYGIVSEDGVYGEKRFRVVAMLGTVSSVNGVLAWTVNAPDNQWFFGINLPTWKCLSSTEAGALHEFRLFLEDIGYYDPVYRCDTSHILKKGK